MSISIGAAASNAFAWRRTLESMGEAGRLRWLMGISRRRERIDGSDALFRSAALSAFGFIAACSAAADPVPTQPGTDAHVADPGTDAHVDAPADPMVGETSMETGSMVGPEASIESAPADVGNVTPGDALPESSVEAATVVTDAR